MMAVIEFSEKVLAALGGAYIGVGVALIGVGAVMRWWRP